MKIRSRNFICIELIGLVIISMCWGCAGLEQKVDNTNRSNSATGQQSYFLHTARWSGETMYYVAEWYTGDAQNAVREHWSRVIREAAKNCRRQ